MATPRGLSKSPSQSGTLAGFFKNNETRYSILIPLNLLMNELDYRLSINALNEFAARHQSQVDWKTAYANIINLSNQFSVGTLDEAAFRVAVSAVLDMPMLTQVSFDEIWAAMLGDLSPLPEMLDELKVLSARHDVIIYAGTNPLHVNFILKFLDDKPAENIAEAKTEAPADKTIKSLKLNGLPFYVSYLQTDPDIGMRSTHNNILNEIGNAHSLAPNKIILITALKSLSPDPRVKRLNETFSEAIRQWAMFYETDFLDYKRGEGKSVVAVLEEHLRIKNNATKIVVQDRTLPPANPRINR